MEFQNEKVHCAHSRSHLFYFLYDRPRKRIPQTFIIEEINYNAGTIAFEDCNQNIWKWISDPEDLEVGDIVAAIMYDNNTKTIYDDQIIEIRYIGNIKSWE